MIHYDFALVYIFCSTTITQYHYISNFLVHEKRCLLQIKSLFVSEIRCKEVLLSNHGSYK